MQCHNYARGSCDVSHSLSIAKANKAVIEALETAVNTLQFTIEPAAAESEPQRLNFDKLISSEKNKLKKIKEAYLSGVDTLEEYQQSKAEIQETINRLEKEQKANQAKADSSKVNKKEFSKRVINVLDFIKSPDVSEQAKNEALRTIISKIIYVKLENRLDIIFYT